ncbi:hypothetical protein SLA2020_340940 [Shorea laevis]
MRSQHVTCDADPNNNGGSQANPSCPPSHPPTHPPAPWARANRPQVDPASVLGGSIFVVLMVPRRVFQDKKLGEGGERDASCGMASGCVTPLALHPVEILSVDLPFSGVL